MTFLLSYIATDTTGRVVHAETVVADVASLTSLTKRVYIAGEWLDLRIEFDPPVAPIVVEPSDLDAAAP